MLQRLHHPLVILGTLALFAGGFAMYVTISPTMFESGPTADELWPGTNTWVDEQLHSMTLQEKVSQLFSARAYSRDVDPESEEYRRLVSLVEDFGIGGITFFQGEPLSQAALANDLQARSRVPLLVSQDMEWGSGMRLEGGTTFPRAMALGAARDPDLAYLAGFVTGREARTLGTHQVFAPVADVNNNPNNPIINVRSFGERPELVAEMAGAFARGVQDAGAIATAKHFPGHGDTAADSHVGLPVLRVGLDRLETLEMIPFERLVDGGIMSVMTGHLAFPDVEKRDDLPASLSHRVTNDLLRERLGFNGLIVTDGLDMGGVTSRFSTGEIAVRALDAGADLLLLSEDPYEGREAILAAVSSGRLSEARIDASVTRILRAKAWLRLDASPTVDLDAVRRVVASENHLALSETIARRALTLLRNDGDLMPLSDTVHVLTVRLSDRTDSTAVATFASELRRRLPNGVVENRFLGAASTADEREAVLEESAAYDAIVVPAEVNVRSGSGEIGLSPAHAGLISQMVGGRTPVVLISFGNPYIVMGLPQPAVYLAAYSNSAASQRAAVDALLGGADVSGRLPIRIPNLYAYGDGLDLRQRNVRTGRPSEVGLSNYRLARADSILHAAIVDRAFPGAALAIGRRGIIAKMDGYGYYTYDRKDRVTPRSVYDIASLTKVVATTTAAMKLYDEGRLDPDDLVTDYLPAFGVNGKGSITIRQLMTHSAGLIPFRPFHEMGVHTRAGILDEIMNAELVYRPGRETRYSDLGFITMMRVIEEITRRPFDDYVESEIFEPLGMRHTGFRATGTSDPTVVPTEDDRRFRGRLIQGEVHDETAWLMGGVSGNAGVFSTAEDLAAFAYMLVNGGRVDGRPFIKPETIRLFTRAQDPDLSTRGLGWDTKPARGFTSAGELFGPNSFGHTGFTGTSIWIDPDVDMFVILLTNRVYPSRRTNKIGEVRQKVADAARGAVIGPATFVLTDVKPYEAP